jgi:hypothetical protein
VCLAASILASLGGASLAGAQYGTTDRSAEASRSHPDFWFGRPRGQVGVRAGWSFARTESDLFDFAEDTLTIEHGDFDTPVIGCDVAFALTPRVDALAGVEFLEATVSSEFRKYVDNFGNPITQDTSLTQLNVSGSVRFSLVPRGRDVGRFAWVPRSLVPYLGGGGGLMWFRFRQHGDFVDYADLSVFNSTVRSQGWTPNVHVFGGVDRMLNRRMSLNLEARYVWAAGELGRDFAGFDPLDLTGVRVAAGVSLLF